MSITNALGSHQQFIGGPLHGKRRYILNGVSSHYSADGCVYWRKLYLTTYPSLGTVSAFVHEDMPSETAVAYLLSVGRAFEILSECIGWVGSRELACVHSVALRRMLDRLSAVRELHKEDHLGECGHCWHDWPCPTIQKAAGT